MFTSGRIIALWLLSSASVAQSDTPGQKPPATFHVAVLRALPPPQALVLYLECDRLHRSFSRGKPESRKACSSALLSMFTPGSTHPLQGDTGIGNRGRAR